MNSIFGFPAPHSYFLNLVGSGAQTSIKNEIVFCYINRLYRKGQNDRGNAGGLDKCSATLAMEKPEGNSNCSLITNASSAVSKRGRGPLEAASVKPASGPLGGRAAMPVAEPGPALGAPPFWNDPGRSIPTSAHWR